MLAAILKTDIYKKANMITAVLINMDAETKILKYDTTSEEDAFNFLLDDWINGKIVWSYPDTNLAIDKNWLKKYGSEPLSDYYDKQYENGVRVVTWHYCGERESDDHIVSCYLIHSIK